MPDQIPERFRGSSEVPLTDAGVQKARTTAMKFAQRGGLDELMASSLGRTVHTAKILSQYTHAPLTYVGDGLHPWHLGQLEGQAVTPENASLVEDLMKNRPNDKVPGRGPLSTADGESFQDFEDRTKPMLWQIRQRLATNPNLKLGIVSHYRVKKLLQAWMRNGMEQNGPIDREDMAMKDKISPGGIDRFTVDPYAGPQMSSVDLDHHQGNLLPGAYFIRHEETAWNDSQS